MHIQIQFCSMAVMVILLYLFLRQKQVGLFSEQVFLGTLIVTMISAASDIATSAVYYCRDTAVPGLWEVVCRCCLVSVVWVSNAALAYTIADLFPEKKYRRYMRGAIPFVAAEAFFVCLLPLECRGNGDAGYTAAGAAALFACGLAAAGFLATVFVLVRFAGRIDRKKRRAVAVWMVLVAAAGAVQFINREIYLTGLANGLGMMTLYCSLENPDNHVDHAFGCFHNHVFARYLNQCYERKLSRSVMFISFINERQRNIEPDYMDMCMHQLISWLVDNSNARVFRSVEQEVALVFPNMSDMSRTFASIQETFYYDQFYRQSGVPDESTIEFPASLFILFPDTLIVDSMGEIMTIRRMLYSENRNITTSLVSYVNRKILEDMWHRDVVMGEIIQALDEDRVEVFFQPTYAAKEERFVSAEALARIKNRDGTYMPPNVFIPVAEETGLISRLGRRVFEKVCVFLRDNDIQRLGIGWLEVNLSVIQCEERNLAEHYLEIMKHYGVQPRLLNLEITETGSVSAKNTLLKNMNQLIAQGVSFSLDDFGNGHSNLNYMIDMPVSAMKLDTHMIQGYFTEPRARVVVQSTIRLAHELGLSVVAEGVESRGQFDEMVRLGVDYIQGFYFSKPLPADEYLKFVAAAGERQTTEK